MKRRVSKKSLIIIMPAVIIIVGVIFLLNYKLSDPAEISLTKERAGKFVEVIIDQNLFFGGVEKADKDASIVAPQMKIVGGIVSHHDLASVEIARFFRLLKLQNPNVKNFIVIGPNHRDIAIAPSTTTALGFETPLGRLDNDLDLTNSLVKMRLVNFDEVNFAPEHSIKVLTPFIKNYFPNAEIVPIILTSKNSIDDDKRLASAIVDIVKDNPDTVVIGSIDFSHYLASDVAEQKDKVTEQAIEKYDYEKIAKFSSDNLDSPPTLITLLETMRLLGADKQQVLTHTNSAKILGADLNYSTSYYTIIFGRE